MILVLSCILMTLMMSCSIMMIIVNFFEVFHDILWWLKSYFMIAIDHDDSSWMFLVYIAILLYLAVISWMDTQWWWGDLPAMVKAINLRWMWSLAPVENGGEPPLFRGVQEFYRVYLHVYLHIIPWFFGFNHPKWVIFRISQAHPHELFDSSNMTGCCFLSFSTFPPVWSHVFQRGSGGYMDVPQNWSIMCLKQS